MYGLYGNIYGVCRDNGKGKWKLLFTGSGFRASENYGVRFGVAMVRIFKVYILGYPYSGELPFHGAL